MSETVLMHPSVEEIAAVLRRLEGPGAMPAAAGDPCGYMLGDGTQHVVYRGADNQLHEFWWFDQWYHNNLSAAAGNPPLPAGMPCGYILGDETQHVIYRGADSKIHELWWNGQWHYNNLTAASGNAPVAAGDPFGYILFNTQHVMYRGADNHVHEIWCDGSWHHSDLNVAAGNAPAAASDPIGYVLFDTQHVIYRGFDNQIHELWWDGSWHHSNLNVAAGNAPTASGKPCGYSHFTTQHVFYRGSDKKIHELWWDGAWHHSDLSASTGNPSAPVGNPCAWTLFNTQHVAYRGADSNIHELWSDGGWHHNNLSVAAGNPTAPAGEPCAYILWNTQHVIYRGVDKKIYELWWDGGWHSNCLTVAAGLRILAVELIPQYTGMWCWAASAEMIMKYLGHDVKQCSQANHEFGRTDCCAIPTPSKCVNGGWPEFPIWGFVCKQTPNGTALTYAQLQAQIDANRPFWFSWWWTGGGGHAMIVRGYSLDTDMVYINDPWPPNVGNTRWVTYAEFVSKANHHTHAVDFYDIQYTGPGAREEEIPAMLSESMPAKPSGYADSLTAAREALNMFPKLVTAANAGEMGFSTLPHEASVLSLGEPLPVFYVRHDALKAHAAGDDVRGLLVDGEELVYPVIQDGQIVSSVSVAKEAGVWTLRSIGNSNLIKDLTAVRAMHAGVSGQDAAEYFVVHIPAMNEMFVAHYEAEKLMLTPVAQNLELRFERAATQTGDQILEALVPRAKEDRQALPKR